MKDRVVNIEIRQEQAKDFPAVYNLHFEAFGRKDEARLADRLRLSDAFIPELSLVAVFDKTVVGHIMFTKTQIVDEGRIVNSLILVPMAVIPELQNRRIGTQLVHFGMKKALDMGYKSIVVLGQDGYYTRFGFAPTTRWQIKAPFNIPANIFMAIELVENSLSDVKGTVRIAEEFHQI